MERAGYLGYIVEDGNEKIFIAGDTDINEDNMKVKCDIALLPIGGTYTMTYDEAAKLANIMKPRIVIPTHYGSVVGQENDALKFKNLVDHDIEVSIQKLY